MKSRYLWPWSTLILIGLVFTGCRKSGCTDPDAVNYDSVANKEDHSCEYEGRIVFWYSQNVAADLIGDGASSLIFKVDGEIIGSTSTAVYWTSSPDCGGDGTITATKAMGNAKSLSGNYVVEDQTGWVYWQGSVNFVANTCGAYQLTN